MSYFVQSGSWASVFGGTTITPTLTGVGAGNLLILELHWQQDSGLTTAPATPTNEAWALPTGGAPAGVASKGVSSYRTGCAVYYLQNASTGSHSAVITCTTGGVMSARIHEFNSGFTSGSFDKLSSGSAAGTSNSAGGSTGTTGTLANANSIVFATVTGPGLNGVAAMGITDAAGYTSVGSQQHSDNSICSGTSYHIVTTTTAVSASWTWTGATGEYEALVVAFKANAPVTPPKITSISPTTITYNSPLTINGTNFGTTQGTGSVSIGGVAQTILTWSNTSITLSNVARGSLQYGLTAVFVTDGSGNLSNGWSANLVPQTGWSYVNLITPNTTTADRLTASADIVSGDQLAYDTKGGNITINSDAAWVWGQNISSTSVEAWVSGSGWGTPATETLIVVTPAIRISKAQFAAIISARYVPIGPPLTATILAVPVVGTPLTFTISGFHGTFTSYQWAKNTGSGPVSIGGATSATYTPVSGDVGAWISVSGTSTQGNFASQTFTTQTTVISQTGVLTTVSPGAGLNIGGLSQNAGVTVKAVSQLRVYAGTNYVDSIVAPGFYSGLTLGNPGGSIFSNPCKIVASLSTCPCVAQQTDSAPATMSRPAASTGVGFWTANGALYDANGNKCRLRGANRLHWDANTAVTGTVGLFNTKANCQRLFTDFTQTWASANKPLVDDMITTSPDHRVIPILSIGAVKAFFTGSISGNTLTVTAVSNGVIGAGPNQDAPNTILRGTGIVGAPTISVQLTNTNGSGIPGKEGTYTIVGSAQTVASTSTMNYYVRTTNNTTPAIFAAAVQTWVENYSNLASYERYMILNIANEWGPAGTSGGNTIWRDTVITGIAALRLIGYKCTIMIDAPSDGQDNGSSGNGYSLLNHTQGSTGILQNDSQKNTIFSLHVYGSYRSGGFAATALALRNLSVTTNGPTFCIGEFGPSYQNTQAGSFTNLEALELIADCEANNLGWIAWALDDPSNNNGANPYAMIRLAGSFNPGGGGYQTSNSAELTPFGLDVVTNSTYGLQTLAVPATIF